MHGELLAFAAPLIGVGGLVAALGLIALAVGERARSPDGAAAARPAGAHRGWFWLVAAITLFGALLRLTGLDAHGIAHPEVYIPGIPLPAGLSEPPPRITFAETFYWHWRAEPHPVGYYMAMWAWTKVFGAGIISLRLPEAILGLLSVPLIYRIGVIVHSRPAGAAAAAMLALSGFHIFWSQMARMYVPGAFLGLLATWVLLELQRRARPAPLLELGYVAAILACAMTVEFAWLLLFTHIAWTALRPASAGSRAVLAQTLALILSAPNLSQAMIGARGGAAGAPSLEFLIDYFGFGFLFQHGAYDGDLFIGPLALRIVAAGACVALIAFGLRRPHLEDAKQAFVQAPSVWRLAPVAAGVAILMLGIAADAPRRNLAIALAALLPLIALATPALAALARRTAAALPPALRTLMDWTATPWGLIVVLAVAPVAALFVISFKVELLAPRAFTIFVPYLLILAAAGAVRIARTPLVAITLAVGLIGLFGASAVILRQAPHSQRDYRGLAAAMEAKFLPGDIVLARPAEWSQTPMYYYLDPSRLQGAPYAEALARRPRARIWVMLILRQAPTPEMTAALAAYRPGGEIKALNMRAILYLPPER